MVEITYVHQVNSVCEVKMFFTSAVNINKIIYFNTHIYSLKKNNFRSIQILESPK